VEAPGQLPSLPPPLKSGPEAKMVPPLNGAKVCVMWRSSHGRWWIRMVGASAWFLQPASPRLSYQHVQVTQVPTQKTRLTPALPSAVLIPRLSTSSNHTSHSNSTQFSIWTATYNVAFFTRRGVHSGANEQRKFLSIFHIWEMFQWFSHANRWNGLFAQLHILDS